MSTINRTILASLVALFLFSAACARAESAFGFDTSLNVYTESPYNKLPLKSVRSVTHIEGPIAQTHIVYTFIDGMKQTMEVGLNFHLPQGAILNGFGYYYGMRFIKGKIYDNDEAWKIYQAVTSRGRDPGIMDRPSQQDYHTQIYPVLPGQYLMVIVELTQVLPASTEDQSSSSSSGHGTDGSTFSLPLQQSDEVHQDADIDSSVIVAGIDASRVVTNLADHTTTTTNGDGAAVVRLTGHWKPDADWNVTIKRPQLGVQASSYSRFDSSAHRSRTAAHQPGAFTAAISAPWPLENARISTRGSAGASLPTATAFGDVPPSHPLSFSGRYRKPGPAYVTVHSTNHRPFTVKLILGSTPAVDRQNPAARIWADKRITALQNNTRRNCRGDIVRLSKRYNIVSQFTALLAIPAEELENYRKHLAKHEVNTNTEYTGGGGGDPLIWIHAPADAQNVVAVFPDGTAKSLTYDERRKSWTTRFDIPLGAPAGEFDVTIIVVHADGHRNRFVLIYQNLTDAPSTNAADVALSAVRGGPATVRIKAEGVAKATLVTPWMERVPMRLTDGEWTASVTVPLDWKTGTTPVSVILYDGAHDRTEVSIDVEIK